MQRSTRLPRWFWLALIGAVLGSGPALAGDGTAPWKRHTIDRSSRGADGVRLADVNGDGLPDIATPWEEGGVVRVCLNPGPAKAAEPWPSVTVGRVASPEDAVLVDLDGDGAADVVTSCEGRQRTMFIHWAPADRAHYLERDAWHTEPIPATAGARMWMFCLPLQIDGRNGPDLVAGSKGADAAIGWLQSPANPRELGAWTWNPICPAGWIMSLVPHDVDGDGDVDIVTSDRRGSHRGCWWLENPGTSGDLGSPWPAHPVGGADREVMFLTLADLDQDGPVDVVCSVSRGDLLYLRRTTASPPAWEIHSIPMPPGTGTGKGVQVGDIDGDGKPDIVFTCEHAEGKSGVMWLSCDGAPTEAGWTAHDISGVAQGIKYDLVELVDLDADGDLDALTCEERDNLGVNWYENPAK